MNPNESARATDTKHAILESSDAESSIAKRLQETRIKDGLRIAQLEALLRPFVEGFKADPGTSDLDNEQPIVSWVTLGHWRKASYYLLTQGGDK